MELENKEVGNLRFDLIRDSAHRKQHNQLLDQCFPVQNGKHFIDDFPVWGDHFQGNSQHAGAFNQGKLVSAASIRLARLKAAPELLPVAIVGGVVTDPSWRGKGIASILVSTLVDWAEKNGAFAVFLWGSDQKLYQKLGFELCGIQSRVKVKTLIDSSTPPIGEHRTGWQPALFQKIQERYLGVHLEKNDFIWYSQHKNVKWIWSGPLKNPNAFVAYGRGVDLQGIVHEWGGPPEEVKGLLRIVSGINSDAEILGHPILLEKLGARLDQMSLEYLCMAKVLRPQELVKAYFPETSFEAKKTKEGWNLVSGDSSLNQVSESKLVKILFGPEEQVEFHANEFPLLLWFWGLDAC